MIVVTPAQQVPWPAARLPPAAAGNALPYAGAVHLGLVAIVVSEYDPAIRFFVDALGFELAEDSPDLTTDGRQIGRAHV